MHHSRTAQIREVSSAEYRAHQLDRLMAHARRGDGPDSFDVRRRLGHVLDLFTPEEIEHAHEVAEQAREEKRARAERVAQAAELNRMTQAVVAELKAEQEAQLLRQAESIARERLGVDSTPAPKTTRGAS